MSSREQPPTWQPTPMAPQGFNCATCGALVYPNSLTGWWCFEGDGLHDARPGALLP